MTFEEYRTQIAAYDCATYFEKYPEIDTTLEHLGRQFDQMEPAVRAHMLDSLEVAVENVPDWMKIHFLSFCMAQKRDPYITEKLLDTVLAADYSEVGEYNKLSHYWQITRAVFTDGTLKSSEVERKLTGLYHTLFEAFSTAVGVTERCYIPRKERNQNLVIVFSPQVLGLGHAPTKTLLDRSYVLKTFLHKEVMIVNTAMYMTKKGRAPFYHMQEAEYAAELSELSSLEFKGETFSYMQCPEDMPDLQVIASLVQLIRDRRPDYIIGIGGNDICADICGRIVPQITVSTVFSGIATSCGEWQMVGKRTLSGTDEMRLQELGVQKECVKCVPFTFSFKPQQDHYTRADLTLPEEKFLVATVGWRLDDEVTGAYLKMLEEAVGDTRSVRRQVSPFWGGACRISCSTGTCDESWRTAGCACGTGMYGSVCKPSQIGWWKFGGRSTLKGLAGGDTSCRGCGGRGGRDIRGGRLSCHAETDSALCRRPQVVCGDDTESQSAGRTAAGQQSRIRTGTHGDRTTAGIIV